VKDVTLSKLLAPAVLLVGITVFSTKASGAPENQITLFEQPGFSGPSLRTIEPSSNLHLVGFANKTSSFSVARGTWQLCDHANFTGQCITVGPGRYGATYDNGFRRSRPRRWYLRTRLHRWMRNVRGMRLHGRGRARLHGRYGMRLYLHSRVRLHVSRPCLWLRRCHWPRLRGCCHRSVIRRRRGACDCVLRSGAILHGHRWSGRTCGGAERMRRGHDRRRTMIHR
jgi:hypothetical protein